MPSALPFKVFILDSKCAYSFVVCDHLDHSSRRFRLVTVECVKRSKEKRARSISGSEAGGGKSKRARLNSTMDPSVNHTTMPPQDSGGKDMGNGSSTDAGESNRIAGGESGSSEMEKEAGTGEAEERAGEVGDKEGDDARKADFGRLTDLADALLQAGQHDIYQQTKEELEEAAAAAAAAHAARAAVTGEFSGSGASSEPPAQPTLGKTTKKKS